MIHSKDKIIINHHEHLLYEQDTSYSEKEMMDQSEIFYHLMNKRRSIRMFSDKAVPKTIIQNLILTASTSPSGAHKQPWTFCAISNKELKSKIRIAAEAEEKISYESRMSTQWKKDLKSLGTDMHKPFIETAPWIIVAFKKVYDLDENNNKQNNYYVNESVGIACGILISAIHNAGLVTLTHTPSPMNFLAEVLKRPKNERAYILFPVGYAADNASVPSIERKPLEGISVFYE